MKKEGVPPKSAVRKRAASVRKPRKLARAKFTKPALLDLMGSVVPDELEVLERFFGPDVGTLLGCENHSELVGLLTCLLADGHQLTDLVTMAKTPMQHLMRRMQVAEPAVPMSPTVKSLPVQLPSSTGTTPPTVSSNYPPVRLHQGDAPQPAPTDDIQRQVRAAMNRQEHPSNAPQQFDLNKVVMSRAGPVTQGILPPDQLDHTDVPPRPILIDNSLPAVRPGDHGRPEPARIPAAPAIDPGDQGNYDSDDYLLPQNPNRR